MQGSSPRPAEQPSLGITCEGSDTRGLNSNRSAPRSRQPSVRSPDQARDRRHRIALPLGILVGFVALAVVLTLVLVTGGSGIPGSGQQDAAPPAYPEGARPAGTATEFGKIPVGVLPTGIVVSPDGSRAYTVNARDVTVIDIATGTATACRATSC
jgi:hypothetical protein